jgi:hypothetical protein
MRSHYWRRAHPVRLPDRPDAFVQIHLELGRAYRLDLCRHELERDIEQELRRAAEEDD